MSSSCRVYNLVQPYETNKCVGLVVVRMASLGVLVLFVVVVCRCFRVLFSTNKEPLDHALFFFLIPKPTRDDPNHWETTIPSGCHRSRGSFFRLDKKIQKHRVSVSCFDWTTVTIRSILCCSARQSIVLPGCCCCQPVSIATQKKN